MDKNNKIKKFNIFILIAIILVCIIMSLAWFLNLWKTDKKTFRAGHIDSIVKLYRGNDFDQDGYLDVDDADNEQYTLIDTTEGKEAPIYMNIKENSIFPSQIYTYKAEIENNGDIDGEVQISLEYQLEKMPMLKLLSISNKDGVKQYLGANTNSAIVYSGDLISCLAGQNVGNFIIHINVEDREDLIKQGVNITEEEYQNLQGDLTNIVGEVVPYFKITLKNTR